jgi:hypothetical protein
MNVAQSLASALASHNWEQTRSIFPSISEKSDAQLQADYGGLNDSTVVVTHETPNSDGTVNLTGGYIAWETVHDSQQTSVYCIGWHIDPAAQTVLGQATIGAGSLTDVDSGWAAPSSLVSDVSSQC